MRVLPCYCWWRQLSDLRIYSGNEESIKGLQADSHWLTLRHRWPELLRLQRKRSKFLGSIIFNGDFWLTFQIHEMSRWTKWCRLSWSKSLISHWQNRNTTLAGGSNDSILKMWYRKHWDHHLTYIGSFQGFTKLDFL